MIGLDMLSCNMLSLNNNGIYRGRDEVLTPPQSSPESHHSNVNIPRDSHHLDQSESEISLPPNIPDILLCKFAINLKEKLPQLNVELIKISYRNLLDKLKDFYIKRDCFIL